MNSYAHIWRAVFQEPWAITPETLDVIAEIVSRRVRGERLADDEIRARIDAAGPARQAGGGRSGSVGVLDLMGVLAQRVAPMEAMSGATSTESFGQAFKAAMADPGIASLVLNVDSPGGSVFGTGELADLIYSMRGDKPIVAVANSLAASAAYWIASACDELVVTPGGEVGSIGVIAMHQDISRKTEADGTTVSLLTAGKYKAEGNPYQPLNDEARAALQSRVDEYYGMFTSAVAKFRRTPVAQVRDGYGQGRVVGAKEAVRLGMADRVDTLDATIARLARGGYTAPQRGQALDEAPVLAYRTFVSDRTITDDQQPSSATAAEEDLAPNTAAEQGDGDLERRRRRARLRAAGYGILTG